VRGLRCVCLIGLIAILAAVASACSHASTTSVKAGLFNVSGSVLLKDAAAALRPRGGLTVTALSPDSRIRPVTTRTAADGTFRFDLRPGWYLLVVDYWGEPAVQIKAPGHGVALTAVTAPSKELADTAAVGVHDVPDVIPALGVCVDGRLVFLRPRPVMLPHSVMSRAEAIAGHENTDGTPARAVLATVTAPGTNVVSQGAAGTRVRSLRHWLAWVVVRTFPRPGNVRIGGFVPVGVSVPPLLALHDVSLIDARTGASLLGFETK
jgi:hypothetical protein